MAEEAKNFVLSVMKSFSGSSIPLFGNSCSLSNYSSLSQFILKKGVPFKRTSTTALTCLDTDMEGKKFVFCERLLAFFRSYSKYIYLSEERAGLGTLNYCKRMFRVDNLKI